MPSPAPKKISKDVSKNSRASSPKSSAVMKMKTKSKDLHIDESQIKSPKPARIGQRGRAVTKWTDAARQLLREAVVAKGNGCRCISKNNWPAIRNYFNERSATRGLSLTFQQKDMKTCASQMLRIYQNEKLCDAIAKAKAQGSPPPKNTIGRRVKPKENPYKGLRAMGISKSKETGNGAQSTRVAMADYDQRLQAEVVKNRALLTQGNAAQEWNQYQDQEVDEEWARTQGWM